MTAAFVDPTRETQRAFRAILEALARPTRAFDITGPTAPPAPLGSAAAAIALTVCDEDSPVWLDTVLGADASVAAWFAFYTGAPVIADHTRAGFVFATRFALLPPLAQLAAGTHEQPHHSATIVLDVAGQQGGPHLRASGPGIDAEVEFAAPWAPPDFVDVWRHNNERFPLGFDLLLVEGMQVRGLPRTTRLEGVR